MGTTTSFFHTSEVALPSHICLPIRQMFRQHLNSHIAYPGSPPEHSNHTRGQFEGLMGLKIRVGCLDRQCVRSDADETSA